MSDYVPLPLVKDLLSPPTRASPWNPAEVPSNLAFATGLRNPVSERSGFGLCFFDWPELGRNQQPERSKVVVGSLSGDEIWRNDASQARSGLSDGPSGP